MVLNGKKKDTEDLILNATVVMKSPIPDKASIVKRNWLKKELRDF
jgi:hypothetical protein